jgi:hypothetical protein
VLASPAASAAEKQLAAFGRSAAHELKGAGERTSVTPPPLMTGLGILPPTNHTGQPAVSQQGRRTLESAHFSRRLSYGRCSGLPKRGPVKVLTCGCVLAGVPEAAQAALRDLSNAAEVTGEAVRTTMSRGG